MPRPQPKTITFTIDGLEVQAPENAMLVDAAKHGDVEIPVFCYEPKLGNPVGACRMCLVEIEGIPKLQTGCSTPVKDGMVVHTQTERVKTAQSSVVEFLLINHPLDCPVCDKGGECPLQDITFGWGRGTSRFIEPKRHFVKPLALSPLIAIDRERCILCYRCVRFSQEVSEDYQLVLLERGAHSYVSTFDGHPYVAPFSGNIVELCPVGALTSRAYRFRARPWDIEDSGSVCTLCPSQCNVRFTVRDERVLRVQARDHDEVDDGWLCDKGRFAYQSIHVDERVTQPLVRDGGELRPVSWERALEEAAAGLRRAAGRVGALAGGDATNEEGHLLARLMREGLGSEHLDTVAGIAPAELHELADPELQATVPDLELAHTVLVLGTEPVRDMAILDLRIRKGVRRHGLKLALATPGVSALDSSARLSLRYAPGHDADFVQALAAALYGGDVEQHARTCQADAGELRALAELLRTGGEEVVILYGQSVLADPAQASTAREALLKVARGLGLAGRPGAGLLAVPAAGANGRGLLEAGFAPGYGPGLQPVSAVSDGTNSDSATQASSTPGAAIQAPTAGETPTAPRALDAHGIGAALAAGELSALYLLNVDPLRSGLPHARWDAALEKASTVIAHAGFLTEGLRAHANVVFPAESYAEKEGTVVHPDGRLQRLRPAIGRPGETRAGWQVIAELARRCGHDLGVLTGAMASQQLFAAVPFYAGLTLEEIGGRGVRWQERPAAQAFPAPPSERAQTRAGAPSSDIAQTRAVQTNPGANGAHPQSHTPPSIWDSPEVEHSPALRFLFRRGLADARGATVPADPETVAAAAAREGRPA
ncbi:MAG TPA: NADH-quinone oxidoreductase subunit NuoG [Solirubrobacteraceae bacterium]|nr:NADH-quinone oxidoreductase subunit NuoG [Solirubrobacteraceae bacterium]